MTEQAYFHSVSQQEAFKELDVEEFEILATLDIHTSAICKEMDGKHFPMTEYSPGRTAPPFHPYCRSVTVPYFDDFDEGSIRAARDANGNTYYVPADMTYREWEKQFVSVKGKSSGNNIKSNKAELPKHIKTIDFNDENAIMKEINSFEKKAIGLPYEANCTITSDGKVWYLNGSSGFVEAELIETQKNGSNLKGSYSYHNHPKNETCFSFSGYDVGFFLESGEMYSKASDYKYSYVMKRTQDTIDAKYDDIISEFNDIRKKDVLQMAYYDLIDIDEDEFHETMKILSKKYKFYYERKAVNVK